MSLFRHLFFFLFILKIFFYKGSSYTSDDLLKNNLTYIHVPIRESRLLTRNRVWPNFKGFGCITSDKQNNISYLITTTEHYAWDHRRCTLPSREVEIFKIDVSKKPHNFVAKLYRLSTNCSDQNENTYHINSNLQLCNIKYPGGYNVENTISSILLKKGHKLEIIADCDGNPTRLEKTLDNTNGTSDKCFNLNLGIHKYKNAEFESIDFYKFYYSNNDTLKKMICSKYSYFWIDPIPNINGCHIHCCMPEYIDSSYLRFKTEPNPMIIDRMLIGNPNTYDTYLDKYYTGSLGSDMVRTCGIDKKLNILFYIGSNVFGCSSQFNTDSSIVRINLNNFTYRDRIKFKDMNPPTFKKYSFQKTYYENPTSSIVDSGKYTYITFNSEYSAIFRINISSNNITLNEYIIPQFKISSLTGQTGDWNNANGLINLNYITKSVIDRSRNIAYFLHDPVNRGDTSFIIKTNLSSEIFTVNSSIISIKEIQGIAGISRMRVDSYTGILYIFTGDKKPLKFYHFDENLNKIVLENSCGQDSLELPIERVMRDFSIDYRTGYIYALSEFAPFAGVSRIASKNLQFSENIDSFPITVPYSIAKQHMFNDEHLISNRDPLLSNWYQINNNNTRFYTELLNISSVFESLAKTIIATSVDGPNLPYIFIIDNFGCIPGRGLNNTQCEGCIPGFYSNTISYSSCIPCEKGRAANLEGSIDCPSCLTGQFSPDKGLINCKNCLPGFYNNLIGKSECIACQKGKFLASTGSKIETDCENCLEGEISDIGSSRCEKCPGGSYKSGLFSCNNCPKGKYGENTGGNNIDYCQDCPIGKYLDEIGKTSILNCKDCVSGKINILTGSTSNISCKICDKGRFRSSTMLECLKCPDGKISNYDYSNCINCLAGKYSSNGIFCINCGTGFISQNNGSSFCQECSIGKIANSNNDKCIICDIGMYEVNRERCEKCPDNKYNSIRGSQACMTCQKGYIVANNNSRCEACQKGFYTDDNLVCKKCEKGSFAKEIGSSSCIICPNGYISNLQGDDCIACPKGQYSNGNLNSDHISCTKCSKGKFSETIAGNSPNVCLNCPIGTWSSFIGLNKSSGCIACLPGYYSDYSGADDIYTCKMCKAGKYNSYLGAKKETDCINSRLGTYSLDASNVSIMCPPGKYNSVLGSSSCTNCDLGKYSDEYGTIFCKDCPANSEQNSDKTDWICSQGSYEYVNSSYRECIICPENAFCGKGSKIETISVNKGFWRENSYSLDIIECRNEQYCLGGIINDTNSLCREGHKGVLCDVCQKGYAKMSGMCEVCPENNRLLNVFLSILFLIVVCLVLVFLIKTANETTNTRDEFSGVLKVLTNYLQVFSLAKNFDIKWPPIILTMFNAAETASGPSIQFYSTQCAIGWTYYERFLVYISMPIGYLVIVILVLLIVSLINSCLKKRNRTITPKTNNIHSNDLNTYSFINKWLKTSLVVGLFLMYPTVIKNLLQIINCIKIGDKYYLSKDFEVICFEGEHLTYAYLSYAFIIVYGIGIPYSAFHFLYNYRNRLYSSNVVSSLKFIYIEYKPNRYYWEMVIMFRKVAIIFMSVFLFSSDTSRYQMIVASWLVQFCLFLHILYSPYDTITEFGQLCNKLEIMSLSSLVITLNSGIVFGTTKDNYNLGFFESALSIIVLVINIFICLKFAYHIFITGSTKTKNKIKILCNKVLNNSDGSRRCSKKRIKKCLCGNYIEKIRRWSITKINIPKTLSIYEIPKAMKYNDMLNTRSRGTLLLDKYLERLRVVDKRCYNNLAEKLLQFHSEIELHQRNHLDNVIKYNNIIYNLQELIYKNIDKDTNSLSTALDLFIADAIEHRNTILELYNDGVKIKGNKFKNKVNSAIISKCIDDIIQKIENNTTEHLIQVDNCSSTNNKKILNFEIEQDIAIENDETIVNSTRVFI